MMLRWLRLATCVNVILLTAGNASAGVFRNVVRGLEYSGFQFVGQENPLSGGAEFSLLRNFTGETLDFGSTELTLTGPIQLTFETGGRYLPVLDVSINTSQQPLNYTLLTDVGGQSTTIDGSFLLDATGSINTFGFYDFQFQYSVRETITQDGRFGDEEEFVEYDLGPIDVSGNLFADMLASLFDPLFAASGTPNIFASFSGRYQAEEELNRRLEEARADLLGADLLGTGVSDLVAQAMAGEAVGGVTRNAPPAAGAPDGGETWEAAIPEPPTLLLLAAAILFLRKR